MYSAKLQPFCLSLNVLKRLPLEMVISVRWSVLKDEINMIQKDHASERRQFVWFGETFPKSV